MVMFDEDDIDTLKQFVGEPEDIYSVTIKLQAGSSTLSSTGNFFQLGSKKVLIAEIALEL